MRFTAEPASSYTCLRGAWSAIVVAALLAVASAPAQVPTTLPEQVASSLTTQSATSDPASELTTNQVADVELTSGPASAFAVPDVFSRDSLTNSLQILVIMTLLTIAPSFVLMMTCFVRMIIVLALLRQALGTQTLPPAQVISSLALFLTLLVMAPTGERIHERALKPYLNYEISQLDALTLANEELRTFMFDQVAAAGNDQDIYVMTEYATKTGIPSDVTLQRNDVPTVALIPAFILSELKTAFVIGFRVYLPFLVIDMVVATVLVSMGMMMLPPVLISLPFKLLLFVLADGWHLVVGSLMNSVV